MPTAGWCRSATAHSATGELSFGKESRYIDHRVHGIAGLVTVIGIRYTTARGDSSKALTLLLEQMPGAPGPAPTERVPLAGGDIGDFAALRSSARRAVAGSDLVANARGLAAEPWHGVSNTGSHRRLAGPGRAARRHRHRPRGGDSCRAARRWRSSSRMWSCGGPISDRDRIPAQPRSSRAADGMQRAARLERGSAGEKKSTTRKRVLRHHRAAVPASQRTGARVENVGHRRYGIHRLAAGARGARARPRGRGRRPIELDAGARSGRASSRRREFGSSKGRLQDPALRAPRQRGMRDGDPSRRGSARSQRRRGLFFRRERQRDAHAPRGQRTVGRQALRLRQHHRSLWRISAASRSMRLRRPRRRTCMGAANCGRRRWCARSAAGSRPPS